MVSLERQNKKNRRHNLGEASRDVSTVLMISKPETEDVLHP